MFIVGLSVFSPRALSSIQSQTFVICLHCKCEYIVYVSLFSKLKTQSRFTNMEWSDEMSLKLIEIYKQNPLLWDKTDRDYKVPIKKNKAWEAIAQELDCDESKVRRKMESLLTSYRRELRREIERVPGMESVDVYKSTWFAFDAMQFLNDKILRRRNHNRSFANSSHNDFSSDVSNDPDYEDYHHTSIQDSYPPAGQRNSNSNSEIRCRVSTSPPPTAKRPRIDEISEGALYGEYIARQLDKFDEYTLAVVKYKIGNILFKAQMGKYTKNSLQSNSSSPSQSLDFF